MTRHGPIIQLMRRLFPCTTARQAHKAGYDSVVSGNTDANCSHRWFASPELRDAWVAGRDEAYDRDTEDDHG